MVKTFLIILFILSQVALAQDISRDLEFIETINTQSTPFNFPIYVDLDGSVGLISSQSNSPVSFGPLGHIGWHRSVSRYIRPLESSEFSLQNQKKELGWIEVKRLRWEAGLGLETLLASNMLSLGFTPYKGARQVMIRHKKTLEEKTPGPQLPDDLAELNDWSIGDKGSYQRYGGIQFTAGVNVLLGSPISGSLTIQNLFNVVVSKRSESMIQIKISEEHLNKRRLQMGLPVANFKIQSFKGKKLVATFNLDLSNPDHEELYQFVKKGKLDILQSKLPQSEQNIEWKGSERMGYFGIPGVMAKNIQRSEYQMDFESGEDNIIDVKSTSNSGLLLPVRNNSKIVYQTSKSLILFWYSEINKASDRHLYHKFLLPGKEMGAKGFDTEIPSGTKIGSSLMQMGLSFSRAEIETIDSALLEDILVNYKSRCVALRLDCAKEKRFNKIANTLREWLGKKWNEVRDSLGFLMMEEPALIYSYVKSMKLKKSIYFKFLNQKYQSLEGRAPIEI
jgi:hypothetical protein